MSDINKKTLEHLADLSRIHLDAKKEEKILKDLKNLLGYFQELQEVKTDEVAPMAGGTQLKNISREDTKNRDKTAETQRVVDAFSEREKGYLKVPPIFES